MSHRGVEVVLGRLLTDEAMRRRFRAAPAETLRELVAHGVELNAVELTALRNLDGAALQQLAHALDARLQRAELVARSTDRDAGQEDAG